MSFSVSFKKHLLIVVWLLPFLLIMGASAGRAKASDLIINEVITSNSQYALKDDEAYDIIELYNPTNKTIDLNEYYISDKENFPTRYRLPEKEVAPRRYALIYCSGKGEGNEANFKLKAEGETVLLTKVGETVPTDKLVIPALPHNVSYGRTENGLAYFTEPTLGKANGKGKTRISTAPLCDTEGGAKNRSFYVTLTADDPIYYTTDGSKPTEESTPYESPILVSDTTLLRFAAISDEAVPSTVITRHYLFGTEKYELPIISICSQPGTVTGRNGLWTRYTRRNMETGVNVSYLESGVEKFNIDCGLNLHGQGSRSLTKKSFNLKFRAKYGPTELHYPLFGQDGPTTFNSLVLRGGSEDYNRAMMRDELLTSLGHDTMPNVLIQDYKPVNVFLDGEYYGIYYLRERIDQQFVANHLGGDAEDVDIINGWSILQAGETKARTAFANLLKTCRSTYLTTEDELQKVLKQMNLESFLDYAIARVYTGDRDYPNIRHVRTAATDGKWMIVNFDLDWGFGNKPANFVNLLNNWHETTELNNVILYSLLRNESVRKQFLERLSYHLHTTYQPDTVIAKIDELESLLKHDMVYDRERWKLGYDYWLNQVEFLRKFARERIPVVIDSAINTFHMTDEEIQTYFGDLLTE